MKKEKTNVKVTRTPEKPGSLKNAPASAERRMLTPFTLMQNLAGDMDRMFSDFGLRDRFPAMPGFERELFDFPMSDPVRAFAPPVEVVERDRKLIIRTDLPGLEKDDIHVEFSKGRLTIKGERRNEFEEETDGVFRSERAYGKFYRSLPLPNYVTSKDAKARFRNGVLEVTLAAPKEMMESRKLEITEGADEVGIAAAAR